MCVPMLQFRDGPHITFCYILFLGKIDLTFSKKNDMNQPKSDGQTIQRLNYKVAFREKNKTTKNFEKKGNFV